jgi:hypothetical protein
VILKKIEGGRFLMTNEELISLLQQFPGKDQVVLSELDLTEESELLGNVYEVAQLGRADVELASGEKVSDVTVLYFTVATPEPYTEIEEYKGYSILQYETEEGYRVDFGTKRSIELPTVEAARQLIDNTN